MNPAQRLDFARFTSDALLDCFRRERDILRELSPGIPVTTNFMATNCKSVDYWRWAPEVDVISNDHYLIAEAPDGYLDLAMSADLTRSLAGGGPWLLMEHSTSAVNWQPRNIAKRPGEMRRNTLAHVARGADGAAVLPVAGQPVRRGEVPLGDAAAGRHRHPGLARGRRARRRARRPWPGCAAPGSSRTSRCCGTGSRGGRRSSNGGPASTSATWSGSGPGTRRPGGPGLTADFAHPEADLSRYRLVVVPSLYLATRAAAANLRRYVEGGGTLVVSCFSGIVDDRDRVYPGPYPGALRDVLGLTVEEWLPLRTGERVTLTWQEPGIAPWRPPRAPARQPRRRGRRRRGHWHRGSGTADTAPRHLRRGDRRRLDRGGASWPGPSRSPGTPTARRRAARPSPGTTWRRPGLVRVRPRRRRRHRRPARRRLRVGRPRRWPAAPMPAAQDAGHTAPGGWPHGLELVRRTDGQRRFVTLINHGVTAATVRLAGRTVTVAPGDVRVLTE